uniref:Protein FAR1-RELATED SEQUENCE n=1 Tax=Lactuca sativa TaxID=4236 RepID=A0A9R1WQL7_LACSA|nr:hypothetical protein LSAT_V11C100041150 [Lactuca sativa]
MDEFHLNENNWFNEMHTMRNLWIPAHFKECTFSGLMRATSKSEAENYFYGLLSNSDLRQRCIQRKNDHYSRYTKPDFKIGLKLEILASMVSFILIRLEESDELKTFTIKDIDKHSNHHGQFEVCYKLQLC